MKAVIVKNEGGEILARTLSESPEEGRVSYPFPGTLKATMSYLSDGGDPRQNGGRAEVLEVQTGKDGELAITPLSLAAKISKINLPNAISVGRLFLIPLFLWLFSTDVPPWGHVFFGEMGLAIQGSAFLPLLEAIGLDRALAVLLDPNEPAWGWIIFLTFAGLLDYVDGYFARAWYYTDSGAHLDAQGDKIFVAWLFALMVWLDANEGGFLPVWVAYLVYMRTNLTSFLRSISLDYPIEGKPKLSASLLGKIKANMEPFLGALAIAVFAFYPESNLLLVKWYYGGFIAFSIIRFPIYRSAQTVERVLALVGFVLPGLLYSLSPESNLWIISTVLYFTLVSGGIYLLREAGTLRRWWPERKTEGLYQLSYVLFLPYAFFFIAKTSWVLAGILLSAEIIWSLTELLHLEKRPPFSWRNREHFDLWIGGKVALQTALSALVVTALWKPAALILTLLTVAAVGTLAIRLSVLHGRTEEA
jgi:phosphatidylglycerophosphate synthase